MRKLSELFSKSPQYIEKTSADEFELFVKNTEKLLEYGIWKYNVLEDKGFWSEKMFDIFHMLPRKAPSYEEMLSVVHPDDQEHFREQFHFSLQKKKGHRTTYRIIDKSGTQKYLDQMSEVIVDEQNEVQYLIGTTIDVTERKKVEQKLAAQVERTNKISSIIDAGFWTMDLHTRKTIYHSQRLEDICGYSSIDIIGDKTTWRSIMHPDDQPLFDSRNRRVFEEDVKAIDYRIYHKDGSLRWVRDEVIRTLDPSGNLQSLEGIITDITQQKTVEQQMTHFAYHDYLTDLPNRRRFDDELEKAIQQSALTGGTFAIVYLDIDQFKSINEAFGHFVGDQVLKAIADRLKNEVFPSTFVARMCGDEFSVLLQNMEDEELLQTTQHMLNVLQKPFQVDGREFFVTSSVGISVYPTDGQDCTTLLVNATRALGRAEKNGRNHFQLYMSSMNVESYKLFSLNHDLRKAIIEDELDLYYQPKVQTQTGEIIGAEALIRWHHPEWKTVSAGEIIPLIEENGMISTFTNWVCQTVCIQLNEWLEKGLQPVPVSINISPKLFYYPRWAEDLLHIIDSSGIPPTLLELEITETSLIEHTKTLKEAIELLEKRSIRVSLDDFGTGYSSLLYLKKYHFDVIKIDRRFISPLHENNQLILQSIIQLAHDLETQVCVEGVETEEQLAFLRKHQCDAIQGFLFSKAVPADQFITFLENRILVAQKKVSATPIKNRRNGFRVEPPHPLLGLMAIVQYKGKPVKMGKTEVIIENIGVGGLCFLSHVSLPVNPEMIMRFRTSICGEELAVNGIIVWSEEAGKHFRYGVKFQLSEAEQPNLIRILNYFAIQIRTNATLTGCTFVTENKYRFLEELKGE